MRSETQPPPASKAMVWTGRILSGLLVAFMLLGVLMYFKDPATAADGMAKFGYPKELALTLVIVEAVCVILYAVPQTSVLGAILLTGYLGGAVATHVRIKDPMFVIAVVVGILVWLGLFLRDPRVRALIPLRS